MSRDIGVQSYTYRESTVPEIADALDPLDVSAIELYGGHLSPDSGKTAREDALGTLRDAGVTPVGYGVSNFDDPSAVAGSVGFAADIDAEYVSAHIEPDDDATFDALLDAADDEGIDVAIHNHGPGAMYSSVDEVRSVLAGRPDPRLGACVDTGHFLRLDEGVADVFPAVGDRIHAVHLKDFVDADTEVIPGEGNLDVQALVDGLLDVGSTRAPVIEYELDPDDPTHAVESTVERLREAGW